MNFKCGCEPCPINLAQLFPEARTEYEDPYFRDGGCDWHKVAVLPNGRRISVSGPDTLWVEAERLPNVPSAEPRGHGAFVVHVRDAWRLSPTQRRKIA